jgi:hypothetical protein
VYYSFRLPGIGEMFAINKAFLNTEFLTRPSATLKPNSDFDFSDSSSALSSVTSKPISLCSGPFLLRLTLPQPFFSFLIEIFGLLILLQGLLIAQDLLLRLHSLFQTICLL